MLKTPQAPGDANILKRFYRDNFVTFRRRSKRIVFLESVNFLRASLCKFFHFRDGHVTTFRHHSGAYICQMHGHRLSTLQTSKCTPSESRLSIGTIVFWGKTVYVGCAQDSRRYHKTRKMLFFDLAPPTLQNSGIFHDRTRPRLHFDGLPPKSWRSVVSI